jgi:hypothetical protein
VSESTTNAASTHVGDETIGLIDAEPARPVAEEPVTRSDRARDAAYRSRFAIVYVGLALIAVLGVAALVVGITRSSDSTTAAPATSEFTPSQAGELGAIQLAEAVQRKYRLANGDELVGVVASRNTLQDGNLGVFRVNYQIVQPFDALKNNDSTIVRPQNAIQYSLCGTGTGCTIPGTASQKRFALLKRQGLELALRTFQNDSAVDNVSVFLRPAAADAPWEGYALVFDRAAVNHNEPGLLTRPLHETLPGTRKTVTAAELTAAQVKRIDTLTRSYLFRYRYELIGGRDALMQLQPTKS